MYDLSQFRRKGSRGIVRRDFYKKTILTLLVVILGGALPFIIPFPIAHGEDRLPDTNFSLLQKTPNKQSYFLTNVDKLHAVKKLTASDGYEMAYGHSYIFDVCGDTSTGKWSREVIIAKVEECPFTDDAKKTFYMRAREISDNALSELIEYFSVHKSMPTKGFSGGMSCSEMLMKPDVIALKERLHRYHLHQSTLDDLASDTPTCEQGGEFIHKTSPTH